MGQCIDKPELLENYSLQTLETVDPTKIKFGRIE